MEFKFTYNNLPMESELHKKEIENEMSSDEVEDEEEDTNFEL